MKNCIFNTFIWIPVLLLLTACASVSSDALSENRSTPPKGESIVIGDISDEPTKKIEEYQPLADYLGAALNQVGEVKIAPDIETMAQWMASGEVDLYFDSPYPAMTVSDRSGARPILRRWKEGISEYHTVIFARQDSGLVSIDDLRGQLIAFETNFSTSGFMMPLAYLTQAGLHAVEKDDTTATVAADEVGYVFSQDDRNTIQWVISKKVAAAAAASSDFDAIPSETRDQLTILLETESLPRQVVLAAPDLPASQQAKIAATLVEMDETEEGKAVLTQFEATSQFDSFPEGASTAFARMRELYKLAQP